MTCPGFRIARDFFLFQENKKLKSIHFASSKHPGHTIYILVRISQGSYGQISAEKNTVQSHKESHLHSNLIGRFRQVMGNSFEIK